MHECGMIRLKPFLRNLPVILAVVSGLLADARVRAAEYAVEIDLREQRAYLLRFGRMILESPISSGRSNYETPTGRFQVIEKERDHRSNLYGKIVDSQGRTIVANADVDMPLPEGGRFVNAPMPYFIRFEGGIGMHAGYLPGYAASHGCVRLPETQAIEFFQAVEVGTPVTVFDEAPAPKIAQRPERLREPAGLREPNGSWEPMWQPYRRFPW